MEEEIREILDKKLIGNDINIADIILSYLKKKCFICWREYIDSELKKSYCDVKAHTQLYMDVCEKCIKDFQFHRCYKCKIFVETNRSYTFFDNHEYICCRYCCCSEGYTE